MGEKSRPIITEKIYNIRDLGGIHTRDGKVILDGKLIRSEQLYFASEKDRTDLAGLGIGKVLDLRNTKEVLEKADPAVGDAVYLHLPIIEESNVITHDKKASEETNEQMKKGMADPESAAEKMRDTYRDFVRKDFTVRQFRRFLGEVLETEGAVLWHCTAGKDRAGWSSVLLMEILGVPRETIFEDYLYTNECLKEEVEMLIRMLESKMPGPGFREVCEVMFTAREDYLQAAYDEAKARFGSMEAFLEKGLGIGEKEKQAFREKYLG